MGKKTFYEIINFGGANFPIPRTTGRAGFIADFNFFTPSPFAKEGYSSSPLIKGGWGGFFDRPRNKECLGFALNQSAEKIRQGDASPAQRVRSIAGREIVFDSEGFLLDPHQWSEEVAEHLAREGGAAVLTGTQWRVIRFLREYYSLQGRAPLNRQLKSGTGLSLMEMESLFPGGIKYGARRLAGLPNPRSCGM